MSNIIWIFLIRIIREYRFLGPSDMNQVFKRNPDVARVLLPVALDVLENNRHAVDYRHLHTPAHAIAYRLDSIDSEILQPHADQIIKLSKHYESVVDVLGRLDRDPLPYLLPLAYPQRRLVLGSKEERGLHARLNGACLADEKWKPALLPELQWGRRYRTRADRIREKFQ